MRGPTSYQRAYHFSERMAQWTLSGPPTPHWIVEVVYQTWIRRKRKKTYPRLAFSFQPAQRKRQLDTILNANFVKKVCRSMNQSKWAERWVEIRFQCLQRQNIPMQITYPSNYEMDEIIRTFKLVSQTFDRKLYKGGARRTGKDHNFHSDHPLARHNLMNYNLIMHQLLFMLDIRRKVNAHFYFPLLVTEKVLRRLLEMWQIIADTYGWETADYDTLTDPNYAKDWEVFSDTMIKK